MAIAPGRLLRELRQAFGDAQSAMRQMHGAAEIRPTDPGKVVQITKSTDSTVEFSCKPVVCHVPDRAGTQMANMYIVFSGLLVLRTDSPSGIASTVSYGTNFAYFQIHNGAAIHALGGHYDFVEGDICHPRAHLQLRSQAPMWQHAQEWFPSVAGLPGPRDVMREILDRVRAPSAQMDFLSYMTQIAADHLVDGASGRGARNRFMGLTGHCAPFVGYQVNSEHDSWVCHRAGHWYPRS